MLWFAKSRQERIAEAIADGKHEKALGLITEELEERPKERRLRLQLAEVYRLTGRRKESYETLLVLAEDLAVEGNAAQAIAVLKRLQALEPTRSEVSERLASLLQPAPEPPAPSAEAPAAPVPVPDAEPAAAAPPPSLSTSPLFLSFSPEELLAVIGGMTLATYAPGEIIVTEGEPGGGIFVLTTGSVRAYVRNPEGKNVQVRELFEGDFFGEVSLLTGKPRSATVTASSRCELLALEKPVLDAITETRPHVGDVIRRFYDERAGSTLEAAIREVQTGAGKATKARKRVATVKKAEGAAPRKRSKKAAASGA